ncbi:MAG: DNA repair protein RadC [Desulfuromonadaceae bacterium]|nr:DNA repair protein RadC [Desulfuromonadaceae bacterium]MDD5104874.1 DNA repair protein RadC [Desulfuromonadaceae bacterium]
MQELKLVKISCEVRESHLMYTSPKAVYETCREMAALDREHFVVLHLDVKNRIIARETVSIGSLSQTIVHPREVFKAAVHNGSHSIICVHNHPSGDPSPSTDDNAITCRLRDAGELIGIKVLDHIIIGDNKYFSMVEAGGLDSQPKNQARGVHAEKEASPAQKLRVAIGRCIRALRLGQKMKQNELSRQTGISQTYLSQIENGYREITKDEIHKISQAFKMDVDRMVLAFKTPPEACNG